jgi:hypothetical protein
VAVLKVALLPAAHQVRAVVKGKIEESGSWCVRACVAHGCRRACASQSLPHRLHVCASHGRG